MRSGLHQIFVLGATLAFLTSSQGASVDWHRWRGPDLNGISSETGWRTVWPKEGLKLLWQAQVGIGFSSVTVSRGRVFTLGNKNGKDSIYCFDATTGAEVWRHSYACPLDSHYYEGGPSTTPTVDADVVYTLSRQGHLFSLDAASGKIRWSKNIAEETGAKIPEWGFAGSPLVEGDLLILNVGRAGTAVDKMTGRIVWISGPDASGYSSAVPFDFGQQRAVALFTAKSVLAVDARSGKELWHFPWKTSYDVNAADPILDGGKVFISSGYNRGCAMLQVKNGQTSVLWENKNMRNHFNSCVFFNGFLYGIDGNTGHDALLKCLDPKTGAVKWSHKGLGSGGLMVADGKLIVLGDRGELAVAEASPDGFKSISRVQALGGKCWTVPVLSQGKIYCRNAQGALVCLDVSGK